MSFISRTVDEIRGGARSARDALDADLDARYRQPRLQAMSGLTAGGSGSSVEPTLQAYLRQIGFSEAQARAQAQLAQDEAARRLTTHIPALRDLGVEQRRNIEGGMEDRGLYRSGETQRRLATQRREEERGVYDAQLGAAGGIAGTEADLAWRAASLANQRREYT